MSTKKILACLMASIMACGAFAGCSEKEEDKSSSSVSESSSESSVSESEASDSESSEESKVVATVATPEFEDAIEAKSGDAYLAMVDGQWWIQYWGKIDSALCYDAGVVPITGDGEYTVSLTTDTNGFRFDTTGDANNTDVMASGCSFAAVMVKDGTTLFPNMAIEITSIKVDDKEIEMLKKNYTSSDDGVEMRANIYNGYITEAPEDAHDANGSVYGNPDYSPQIIDPAAAFGNGWTDIEVTFTVTGTGTAAEGGAEAEGAESEAAEGEESAAE